MMSLKPRNVDFQETWANLKETVAGVVGLRSVERSVWNTRFSDVYALCVAHPEPLADRLYDETRNFLEEHVSGLLQRVRGTAPLENNDHNDGLLNRYVAAWREYSQGVAYLNCLYSYLNLQHVKRQKVSDAEIIYGSAATVSCPEHDSRQLEVGELGLVIWERVLVQPLAGALSGRVVAALGAARTHFPDAAMADVLRMAIGSTVQVQAFRVRSPLALYQELVLEPYLAAAAQHHAAFAAELLHSGDISHYMTHVLAGLEREMALGARFLHGASAFAVRGCYERAAVAAHLPRLHAETERLLREACDDGPHADQACSLVVNSRPHPEQPARAPELLARYCDCLLRKRSGSAEADVDDKLAAAIVVFKYVDDKDVFQKYYARALARRLIHQLSASMEQEEAMINRLKQACGYEFTNKLHRMFTDVAVSADLNAKFQQHLRDTGNTTSTGFAVQVLQAGAWPLGGAMAPLAPPAQLERPARLFEAFYRASFSGRRLAWLHHLCTGELRTRYTSRVYHISATTPQCALLLCFENVDTAPARELRETLQLTGDSWTRHMRPLIDAGLLTAEGEVEEEDGEGTLSLNLSFICKRTKVRLTCANAPATQQGGGAAGGAEGGEAAHCDDDRKMYLQAALVRIMKQRKVLRHTELIQEVVSQARGSFAPSVAMIKKCIEALIDKQYLERAPGSLDTYSYLA
ncbi:cullin-2 [Hyposmocoma kahamanoa]|uniref:cullin-2 n=1 Tax=Hyposmocoma kahamanoa TaxID=1477025 RepID=UPI000E6D77C5|nr:cullin-2 [Hyposmocoma kahamanoa]